MKKDPWLTLLTDKKAEHIEEKKLKYIKMSKEKFYTVLITQH